MSAPSGYKVFFRAAILGIGSTLFHVPYASRSIQRERIDADNAAFLVAATELMNIFQLFMLCLVLNTKKMWKGYFWF
ncbi:MAG: hypothetical protein ACKPKO_56285, partial [Candidatus Fonsibacter sp.]